jgi:hypothetical protein
MQSLAQLKPSFPQMGEFGGFAAVAIQAHPEVEAINYVHHAGNSSGIVDGAAAVLIGNKEAGKKAGLKPRARIKAFANIGSEPAIMLTGPVDVTEKLLKKAGMKISDIDLFELNEAFASVALHAGVQHSAREDQCVRRCDRNGSPAGCHRRHGVRHGARRTGAHRQVDRAGHALHRRGHGHRNHHRTRLSA